MTAATKSVRVAPGVYRLPSGSFRGTAMVNTRRLSETFPTMKSAVAWRAGLLASAERGDRIVRGGAITFAQFWPQFDVVRRNPTTALKHEGWWNARIKDRWGRVAMRRVTGPAIDNWTRELEDDGLSEASIRAIVYVMSAMYREAVRHGYVEGNPVRMMVKRPPIVAHRTRILSDDEFDDLIESAPDDKVRGLLLVMRDGGLRIGEAAALTVRNVRADRLVLVSHVDRATNRIVPGLKNGDETRDATVSARMLDTLDRLVAGKKPGDLVFPTRQGGPINLHNWNRRVWHPMVDRANLADPRPTPHDLRRSFGTELGDLGVPTHKIAAALGQNDDRSVARYVKVNASTLPVEVAQIRNARRAARGDGRLRVV